MAQPRTQGPLSSSLEIACSRRSDSGARGRARAKNKANARAGKNEGRLGKTRKYPVSAGHVSPLSKQLPTRVDSLFFKKRREKRMQIFSNWHENRGMEVISSLFLKDRDAEKIYSLLSAAFQKHK